ncbi:hypothetical protein ACJX0J_024985, partial [Zea mays]
LCYSVHPWILCHKNVVGTDGTYYLIKHAHDMLILFYFKDQYLVLLTSVLEGGYDYGVASFYLKRPYKTFVICLYVYFAISSCLIVVYAFNKSKIKSFLV